MKETCGSTVLLQCETGFGCNTEQAPKLKTYGIHILRMQVATPAGAEPGEGSHWSRVDLTFVL